jgi:cell division protein FtsA
MFITALDLGTSQIKVLVAETKKDGQLSLLAVFKMPSTGFRKGEVTVLEEAIQSINRALEKVKQINRSAAKNIFVNIGGSNIRLQNSRGIVAVSRADSEIYPDDVDRAVKASQAINLGPNRMIVHTITKEFIVDGTGNISDPLGMVGNRLEVNSLIIDAFKPTVSNLIKAVETAGGKIGGLIYDPLAAGRAVLTKTQKELGAVMINIGFGTTGMCVYEEDKLVSTATFPIGAGNITNDLAIGLRCSIKTAEAIKLSFGSALAKEISIKDKIDLNQIDDTLRTLASKRFVSEIIEVRLAEIFELINSELKSVGKFGHLPAGAVLTGGGAKTPGIIDLAKQELRLPVQLGIPDVLGVEFTNSEFESQAEDLQFGSGVGLLLWAQDEVLKEKSWMSSRSGFASKVLKYFLP